MDTIINLKTTQSVPVELSLTIPAYYRSKDEQEWLAVLSKEDVISISTIGNNTWISRQGIETTQGKVVEAASKYHSCTESEFIEKFDNVMELIYAHPKLAV